MVSSVVNFQGVSKRFGRIQALKDLSFDVQEGELFGFVGPNGSGKTTTIRIMLDLYRRDTGEVRVLSLDPSRDFHRIGPQLGVTFDQHALYEGLSPDEHLVFWGRMFGQQGKELRARCDLLLEAVGLGTRRRDLVRTFSKGMRQRLAFARSLIGRPQLVIMDEPFDGIDVATKRDLIQLIDTVAGRDGMTAFLTSHNLVDIERLCRRVAVVKRGTVVACDTLEALRRLTQDRRILMVTLGEGVAPEVVAKVLPGTSYDRERRVLRVERRPGEPTEAVLRRLVDSGLPVQGLHEEASGLEDVYLSLTGGGKDVCG